MDDLISRQAAIEELSYCQTFLYDSMDKYPKIELGDAKAVLEALPAAEPIGELIRCKDCIHHHYENGKIPYCDNIDYGYGWKDDDFCSRAERRTDGRADQ